MSCTSTVTCDRCGHTQADYREPRSIHRVSLVVSNGNGFGGDLFCRTPLDWCDVCVKDANLRMNEKEPPVAATAKPTLEELILEIVRREQRKAGPKPGGGK